MPLLLQIWLACCPHPGPAPSLGASGQAWGAPAQLAWHQALQRSLFILWQELFLEPSQSRPKSAHCGGPGAGRPTYPRKARPLLPTARRCALHGPGTCPSPPPHCPLSLDLMPFRAVRPSPRGQPDRRRDRHPSSTRLTPPAQAGTKRAPTGLWRQRSRSGKHSGPLREPQRPRSEVSKAAAPLTPAGAPPGVGHSALSTALRLRAAPG